LSQVSIEEKLVKVSVNKDYVVKEFNSLRKNWPDTYIGVFEQSVKYHDKTVDGLLEQIRSDKVEGVFVTFIPSKQANLVV
jgi:hypothetical protein